MINSNSPKSIVLYADDDADDIQLIKEAFAKSRQDVELITAADGAEALSYLNTLPQTGPAPCLIILDVNMPRLNGKETLVKLRQLARFKKVPVMLFTTSARPADADFAARYNAGFFTKPTATDEIGKIANHFIERCFEEMEEHRKVA